MATAPSFFKECVDAAMGAAEEVLAGSSFSVQRDKRWEEGRWSRRFVRRAAPWRDEIVQIIYPKSESPFARDGISLGLRVELKDAAGKVHYLDGTSLSFVIGRPEGEYRVPRLAIFRNYRRQSLAREIAQDLAKAMEWFGAFDSVDACLGRLKSGESNVGPVKEEGAAREALRVLEAWKAQS